MPSVGDEFGGYRIERVLGKGATGIVYAATDLELKRKVAIKVLARQLTADAQFSERFRREASVQASFEHPHIVAVHAFGEVDGELYLVMRLIRGDPLSALLRGGALTRAESLTLLAQVADALDTAHGVSLVHRDVKPDNILVSDGGTAYLADFGLTRDITDDVRLTNSGMFIGTVNYVSPEQACGLPATAAADVYSLAAVLFECMTGRVPYVRDGAVAVMYAHIRDPIPSARALDPTLPRELDDVIAAGLAKDALDRPGSATELIELARAALPAPLTFRSPPRPDAADLGERAGAPDRVAEGTTLGPTASRRIRRIAGRPPGGAVVHDRRWRRAAARVAAFVLLAAAASSVGFGAWRDEPPVTKGGSLAIATLDRASFGQYLDRIEGTRSDYPRAQLERAGALLGLNVEVEGYRDEALPLRWRVIDARTGDQVLQSRDLSYTPEASEDRNSWPLWVPLPRGSDRRFFVEVELLDDKGKTPLASDRTDRVKGA